LLPNMVYGYNEVEGSVTHQRAEQFEAYMLDALKVRTRVMDILSSNDERTYYSYRMDNLIVSYLLQAYIEKNNVITEKLLNTVSMYIKTMQKTDYSREAMFRIVKVVEQGSKKWSKPLYQQWREVLHSVGIGRPNYYRFKVEVLPKRAKLRGKMKLKHYLKR